MVLGFGSTEQTFEKAEGDEIRRFIEGRWLGLAPLSYFTDGLVADLSAWLAERSKASQAKADESCMSALLGYVKPPTASKPSAHL